MDSRPSNPLDKLETEFIGETHRFSDAGVSPDNPRVKSPSRGRWLHRTLTIRIPVWLLWLLLLLLFGIGVGSVFWNKTPDPLFENFQTLEKGMTLAEVEAILGGPGARGMGDSEEEGKLFGWFGKTVEIWIVFDSKNRIIRKGYHRYKW
jgi:hypothetical protein